MIYLSDKRLPSDTVSSEKDNEGAFILAVFRLPLKRISILLIITNVLVICGTGFVYLVLAYADKPGFILSRPWAMYLLSLLNLASENTIATWYSSMLLFCTSLLALLIFIVQKTSAQRRFTWGWLMISLLFMAMSLDELGSLHENAGKLTFLDVLNNSTWVSVLFIPLVMAMGYMLAFVFTQIKWNTAAFGLMAAGGLLFISIPLQEHVEYRMWKTYGELWNRPAGFVLLEEGCELFGAVSIFAGLSMHIIRNSEIWQHDTLNFLYREKLVRKILGSFVVCIALLFVLTYLVQPYLSLDDGIAINWYPAAMAIFVSVVYAWFNGKYRRFIFLYGIALSVYMGANIYGVIHWDEITLLSWIVRIIMTAGLVLYIYRLSFSAHSIRVRIWIIASGLLISSAFASEHPIVSGAVLAGLLIILVVMIHTRLSEKNVSF